LGAAVERRRVTDLESGLPQTIDSWAAMVPVLDPLVDLGPSVIMRITAVSRAAKPYRYLRSDLTSGNDADMIRVAMQRRREELPQAYAGSASIFGWQEPPDTIELIDRPLSPERGQLLEALVRSGVYEMDVLNFFGLDLSFAQAEGMRLANMSSQNSILSYANFDRAQIVECDFRGGALENTRFRGARVERTAFDAISAEEAKGGYDAPGFVFYTSLAGADFSDAFLRDVGFSQVNAMAVSFDRAALDRVDFSGAALAATTFKNAALLNVKFEGTALQSVDFDGAFVFEGDFLEQLGEIAAPGSFRSDRYILEEAHIEDVMQVRSVFTVLEPEDLSAFAAEGVWRIKRVADFEVEAPEPAKDP